MYWASLILAGLFEMMGVLSINLFHNSKNWSSLILLLASFSISFGLLTLAMIELPMSIAYLVWTGIGVAGSAIVGMVMFNERATFLRIVFLTLIISSTIGLKL